MSTLHAFIGGSNLMVKAALLFGAIAVLTAIAQLAMLRRINLVPALVGLIAITFFTNVLGQTMGLIDAVMAGGSATFEERQVLFGGDIGKVTKPMLIAFALLLLATLLSTIAATLRANRPAPPAR